MQKCAETSMPLSVLRRWTMCRHVANQILPYLFWDVKTDVWDFLYILPSPQMAHTAATNERPGLHKAECFVYILHWWACGLCLGFWTPVAQFGTSCIIEWFSIKNLQTLICLQHCCTALRSPHWIVKPTKVTIFSFLQTALAIHRVGFITKCVHPSDFFLPKV